MQITDILSQYLYEVQYEALKSDEAYQAARAENLQAEDELMRTLSPEQAQLFRSYIEKRNYVDTLELQKFFSRCSLLLLPSGK